MPIQNDTLPVETFEAFMLAGDSNEFPMSFVFELKLDGQIDVARLNQAIRDCVTRHPLLFSTLDAQRKHWRFDRDLVKPIETLDYHTALRFDLTRECGLRVIVPDLNGNCHRIGFVFHHVCTDGMGAFHFISDVAQAYRQSNSNDSTPASHGLVIQHLKRFRASYGGNRLLHFLRWPLDIIGMPWSLEMILNRPSPVEPEQPLPIEDESAGRSGRTGNAELTLTLAQTSQAKQISKSAGQTLNDRVMQSLFFAIEDWNKKFNPGRSGSLIRLMVPMNLRSSPSESAANMVAMVNFDRKVGRWNSTHWFRKILKLEMSAVKRMRAGVTANRYLQLQKMAIGRWPMQENTDRCFATCTLSNLGDVSRMIGTDSTRTIRFGDCSATGFRAITPLRPNTNVFVCVFSFSGQLNLNVTFNSAVLDKTHIEFLLESLQSHLLQD